MTCSRRDLPSSFLQPERFPYIKNGIGTHF